ncbi:Gfo/Idh/MocA family oxidoreductase [Phenylobacterium sp.]|jgi:predicted dehydrogenase|uniref:Gfo/Idh/MocA family protein n=1 Tax=Phenylobacterium sp. TaxID=1871053 RepID=UPI002E33D7B7|nr:Gfo/Idh/MocA family oxidoreductase [Phenylobacterium sp.]HEX3364135.1 Gfo/Idh/MocA family oxidoreductase [Phenylobacterium sp.]
MAQASEAPPPLRIGFIGSGFIAKFHVKSFQSVRHAQITGVYSPTATHREELAAMVNAAELGPCRAYGDLESLLTADDVDAIWLLAPNDRRLEVMQAIHDAVKSRRSKVRAVACEKPLGRTLAEAREVLRLAEDAGLAHGYLENQVFSTAVERGKEIVWRRAVPASSRPYLARAAEEHSGPHEPWFWQGPRQGGGVMSDMMCHSVEVGRFLLTAPDAPRASLTVKSAQGSVGYLKWTQARYAKSLAKDFQGVEMQAHPVEDFARATITLEDETGQELIIEASTSWSYVGPGLRIDLALLGPEYAMEFSSLNPSLKVFLSRAITGGQGEDLVEKQNAEQGQMPIVEDEAGTYGYVGENRHMVDCFRHGKTPIETFEDGVEVTKMVMALYKSAETGQVVNLPDPTLETYVPVPARIGA